MARTRNPHAAAVKAWQTRRGGGKSTLKSLVAKGMVGEHMLGAWKGLSSTRVNRALGLPAWKDRPVRPAGVREAKGYDSGARAQLARLRGRVGKYNRAAAKKRWLAAQPPIQRLSPSSEKALQLARLRGRVGKYNRAAAKKRWLAAQPPIQRLSPSSEKALAEWETQRERVAKSNKMLRADAKRKGWL